MSSYDPPSYMLEEEPESVTGAIVSRFSKPFYDKLETVLQDNRNVKSYERTTLTEYESGSKLDETRFRIDVDNGDGDYIVTITFTQDGIDIDVSWEEVESRTVRYPNSDTQLVETIEDILFQLDEDTKGKKLDERLFLP